MSNCVFNHHYANKVIVKIKEKILEYSQGNNECRQGFQFPSRIPTYQIDRNTGDYKWKNDRLHVKFVRICELEEFTVSRQAKLLHQAMKELLSEGIMFRRYGCGKRKGYVYSHNKVALGIFDPILTYLALEYKDESFVAEQICSIGVKKEGEGEEIYGSSPMMGVFKTYRQKNMLLGEEVK